MPKQHPIIPVVGALLVVLLSASPAHPAQPQTRPTNPVLFTVPVGESGVHYSGLAPEQRPWGPSALKVDDAGTFWISDSAAGRLLRFDREGSVLETIDLHNQLAAIADFELTPGEIVVLDTAGDQPELLWVDDQGSVLHRNVVATKSTGVTGLRSTGPLDVLLEVEGGGRHLRLSPEHSKSMILKAEDDDSLPPLRITPSARQLTIESSTATRIEPLRHTLGRAIQLGTDQVGNLFLLVEQVSTDTAIRVDWQIRKYSPELQPLGVARFPLADQFAYIEHAFAVSPEGDVFGLVTKPNAAEVIKLTFLRSVPDILPAERRPSPQDASSLTKACRSRSTMQSTAAGYVNNSRSLSTTNISGTCSGRSRPRYLTTAKTYSSVSYDWGGWDTPSDFNSYMSSGKQAGDINTSVESCSRGIDCSGLVSRAWGLSSKQGTSTLASYSARLSSTSVMQPGDIVNRAGDHTAMLATSPLQPGGSGQYFYESTTYNSKDRVIYEYHPWSYFSGYTPYRSLTVCGGQSQ